MPNVLLLYSDMPDAALELLQRETRVVGPFRPVDAWQARLQDADAIIVSVQFQITSEVMDCAPSLHVIARPGIGVDNVDLKAATARGICVVNTPDAPTEPVAEKVIGWMIALAHRLSDADRVARENGWQRCGILRGHDFGGQDVRAGWYGTCGEPCGEDLHRRVPNARADF